MNLPAAAPRTVVRTVLIIVAVAISLYVIYLLRQPLKWLFIAAFLAMALSGPVNLLSRKMKRGFAITIVYLLLLTLPFLLAALFVPPLVTEANNLAGNLPGYAQQLTDFVNSNSTLASIESNFDVTERIEQAASTLPSRLESGAAVLSGIGLGLVNSVVALLTILVLCAFMLGGGRRWVDGALALAPPERAERLDRVLDRIGNAVGNYVGGALIVALIAGLLSFIVLLILGVPFAGPLAVIVGLFALIPLVGATIAALIVGVFTLFHDFPTATIVWAAWAIVYQQFENHVIQPQIQRRAVDVPPFVVLVAVIFGSTLFGLLGAIIAIPAAASIRIALREFYVLRTTEAELPATAAGAEQPDGGSDSAADEEARDSGAD
ncbi:MAG: AI-2E family transporter [Thermoleophilaceae bacterium]|nr:AI-2E family transporter [Thermoleophilaceae bacterium]